MTYSYDRNKTAADDSLLSAKVAWAKKVAEEAADRFKSSGGWSEQKTKSTVRVGSSGMVELTTRSDRYGWTGLATFDMENQTVSAMVQVDAPNRGETDLLKMIQEIETGQRVIKIDDREPASKLVEAISLWWSKTVNPLPERT